MVLEQLLVFLREIKDRPDDDLPRLVLADWLQDQGDPRGELIHLQVTRAKLSEDDPSYRDNYRRDRQILGRHLFTWLGPLADLATSWEFRRGFLFVEARAERLLAKAPSALPDEDLLLWLEELRLLEAQPAHLVRLAGSPLLEHLTTLDLSNNRLADAGMAQLWAHQEAFSRLRVLRLASNRIGAHGAALLGRCPAWINLRLLDLSSNRLGEAGARALAESPYLDGLGKLVVSGNGVNLNGLAALRDRFGDRLEIARSAAQS
jgi:uncharacterized protein (TIGR02996 family)